MVSSAVANDVTQVWTWLAGVPDPEIPAISIVDLGIVRDVSWRVDVSQSEPTLYVAITPTYSGCPATRVIEGDIVRALHEHGVKRVQLEVRIAPAWTTDWLSAAGREKLLAYGIAPPGRPTGDLLSIIDLVESAIACPRCGSADVVVTSRFGSTPCKALYRCTACREPFDYFKCH